LAVEVHNRRRRDIALLLLLHAACLAYAGLHAEADVRDLPNWAPICAGLFLSALAWGVWFAREWSRLTAGILGAVSSVGLSCAVIIGFLFEWQYLEGGVFPTASIGAVVFGLALSSVWAIVGLYLLRGSTRARFAEVRQARTRTGLIGRT
jgi:hypothetical protein